MATWGERATQWVYAQPLARSPLFDPTGANCAVGQEGPVWCVARIAGPPVFSGERYCTMTITVRRSARTVTRATAVHRRERTA